MELIIQQFMLELQKKLPKEFLKFKDMAVLSAKEVQSQQHGC